jgi:hypothetical protein
MAPARASATSIDWQAWTTDSGTHATTADGTTTVSAPNGFLNPFPIHFDGALPFDPADAPSIGLNNPGTGGFTVELGSVADTSGLVVGLGNFAYDLGWSYTLTMFDTSNNLMNLATLTTIGSFDHTWGGAYCCAAWNDNVSLNTTTGLFSGASTGSTEYNTDMFLFTLPSNVGKLVITSSGGAGDTINLVVGRAQSVPEESPLPSPAVSVPLLALAMGAHVLAKRRAAAKVLALALVALSLTARAESTTISYDFSTDASQANIAAQYPDWSLVPANGSDAATVSVTDGQLHLGGDQATSTQFQLLTAPVGAFTIDVDLGAFPNGFGSTNIGVKIGDNVIVFHPGYPTTGLRVEGDGGFTNVDVGFTLAAETLHHLTLTGDGLGLFSVTLTDGLNSANTFTTSFTNVASVGGLFSITRAGATNMYGQVYADDFVLTDQGTASVPDSSSTLSLMLLSIGALGFCHRRAVRPAMPPRL